MQFSSMYSVLMAAILVGCGADSTESSTGNNSSSTIGCAEACEVANLSNNDLKARFGSTQVPPQYDFVEPFLLKGVEDFERCIREPGKDLFSPQCTNRGHQACVKACQSAR